MMIAWDGGMSEESIGAIYICIVVIFRFIATKIRLMLIHVLSVSLGRRSDIFYSSPEKYCFYELSV
jgi:hypothetical protein